MSLTFLLEAGAHGPIEPELLKLQMNNRTATYSGLHTGSARGTEEQCGNVDTFQNDVPFTTGLLRQLYLLEWSGLHRLLQTAYDDLVAITEEDRLLLLSSVGIAEVKVRMPSQLIAKSSKNARLMVYLSIWLLEFQILLRDATSMLDKGVVCRLALRDENDAVVTVTATGNCSTVVTTSLSAQNVTFKGVDGLASLIVEIGERPGCQAEKRREPEIAASLRGRRGAVDSRSLTSAGRPPSLTSSLTIESEMGEFPPEVGAVLAMLPGTREKKRKAST